MFLQLCPDSATLQEPAQCLATLTAHFTLLHTWLWSGVVATLLLLATGGAVARYMMEESTAATKGVGPREAQQRRQRQLA